MNKFKVLCLALVAVFALSALAAAGASGDELVNKEGGLVKGKIKLNAKTPQVLETLAGVKVTCQKATGEGEQTAKMNVVIKSVTFKECLKSTGGVCKSAGAASASEIIIGTLNVEAVSNTAKTELLVLTELASEVEFTCAEVKIKVKGGGKFLAKATEQKKLVKELTLVAACPVQGMQQLTKYIDLTGVEKTISETEGLLTKIGASETTKFEGSCQKGEAIATLPEEGELI